MEDIIYNIIITPLYFVRSGYAYVGSGYLKDVGRGGDNWSNATTSKSSSGTNTLSAYTLGASVKNVNPSTGPNSRGLGFPLR